MDTTFACLIAPMGCFSSAGPQKAVQRSTQSFVRDKKLDDASAARKKVITRIILSKKLGRAERAIIEAYFFRFERVGAWHVLSDVAKDVKVDLFYANVKFALQGLPQVVALEEVQY